MGECLMFRGDAPGSYSGNRGGIFKGLNFHRRWCRPVMLRKNSLLGHGRIKHRVRHCFQWLRPQELRSKNDNITVGYVRLCYLFTRYKNHT